MSNTAGTIVVAIVAFVFMGMVIQIAQCEMSIQKMQRDAFTACVAAGRPPAECRLATSRQPVQ